MNTPKPAIDLSGLHPTIAQALEPHVQPRYQYGGVVYFELQYMQAAIARDIKAGQQQMQAENSRTNFGVSA